MSKHIEGCFLIETNNTYLDIYDDCWLLPIKVDTLAKLKIRSSTDTESGEVAFSALLEPSSLKAVHQRNQYHHWS